MRPITGFTITDKFDLSIEAIHQEIKECIQRRSELEEYDPDKVSYSIEKTVTRVLTDGTVERKYYIAISEKR